MGALQVSDRETAGSFLSYIQIKCGRRIFLRNGSVLSFDAASLRALHLTSVERLCGLLGGFIGARDLVLSLQGHFMLGIIKHGCFALMPKGIFSLHIKGLLGRQFFDELHAHLLAVEGSFVGLLAHACSVRGTDLYLLGVHLGLLADTLGVEEGVVDFT